MAARAAPIDVVDRIACDTRRACVAACGRAVLADVSRCANVRTGDALVAVAEPALIAVVALVAVVLIFLALKNEVIARATARQAIVKPRRLERRRTSSGSPLGSGRHVPVVNLAVAVVIDAVAVVVRLGRVRRLARRLLGVGRAVHLSDCAQRARCRARHGAGLANLAHVSAVVVRDA